MDNSDAAQRRLRQLAATGVHPMVSGVRSAWLIGVGRPTTPIPAAVAPIAATAVREVLEAALRRAFEVLPDGAQRFALLRELDSNAYHPPGQDCGDGSPVFLQVEDWGFGQQETAYRNVCCPIVESYSADFAARLIASDIVNQFGVSRLHLLNG